MIYKSGLTIIFNTYSLFSKRDIDYTMTFPLPIEINVTDFDY